MEKESQIAHQVYLIVGLGNPGAEYCFTRHNVGFMLVDKLAVSWQISFKSERGMFGQVAKYQAEGKTIFLVKPTTYMNLSGKAVAKFLQFYRIPQENLLIIYDDVAFELGQVKLRLQGGAGGHNGLKSIQQLLGTDRFCRLRMGIGQPPHGTLEDYVLGNFKSDEQGILEDSLIKGMQAVEIWLRDGSELAMNRINQP